jgi:hypothetical protein
LRLQDGEVLTHVTHLLTERREVAGELRDEPGVD